MTKPPKAKRALQPGLPRTVSTPAPRSALPVRTRPPVKRLALRAEPVIPEGTTLGDALRGVFGGEHDENTQTEELTK